MTFSIDNPEGVATTPPSENMFGKNPQDRAHSNHSIRSCEFEDTEYLYETRFFCNSPRVTRKHFLIDIDVAL